MELINGKKIANQIKNQIKKELQKLTLLPSLQVVAFDKNQLTQIFLRGKKRACEEVGISFHCHQLSAPAKPKELANLIQTFNSDPRITGILVQLPLPTRSGLSLSLLDQIDPNKDVDCLTSRNFGLFVTGNPVFIPPTAQAVNQILQEKEIQVKGKNITVVGAGRIAGLPIALSLLQQGATVTVCHEFSQNLKEHTLKADILISAVGKPGLIKGLMVKKGTVVIDVGTSWMKNRIVGDVDLAGLEPIASEATPVPGGVGPIMIAYLLKNILEAVQLQATRSK